MPWCRSTDFTDLISDVSVSFASSDLKGAGKEDNGHPKSYTIALSAPFEDCSELLHLLFLLRIPIALDRILYVCMYVRMRACIYMYDVHVWAPVEAKDSITCIPYHSPPYS